MHRPPPKSPLFPSPPLSRSLPPPLRGARIGRRPLDAHWSHRPIGRAADAKVSELESQGCQADPKLLDETVGEHGKKKRGPNFARSPARNLAGGPLVSSAGQAQVRHHPPVAAIRGPMRE